MDAQKAADIAWDYAREQFAKRRKVGLVQGSCYETRAYAALEVEERIRKAAGLPERRATVRYVGGRCHIERTS